MVKPGNPGRMPSPGKLAPTRRMEKGTRTQTLPDRLPFETDGPTTGARHEYQHCWPLWQPNQTAHFPALAITRVSGLTTNPGAKAFAPHLPKTLACPVNNHQFYQRVRISRARITPNKTRSKFLNFLTKNKNMIAIHPGYRRSYTPSTEPLLP